MSDLCKLIWCALIGPFRPRAALQAEILVPLHQLNVLRRKSPKRLAFGDVDRLVFTALYHVAPGVLDAYESPESEEDYRHRMIVNAIALVFVSLLSAAGFWLVNAIAHS